MNNPKYRYNRKIQKRKESTIINAKYGVCKYSAKTRNLEFELSLDDWKDIICLPCFYCGTPNKIGIDRADNNIGYIKSNCVPCCWICNRMKNSMQQYSFIMHAKRIAFNHLEIL